MTIDQTHKLRAAQWFAGLGALDASPRVRARRAGAQALSCQATQSHPAETPARPLGGRFKRALDVVISGILLIVMFPAMLMVALLIYFTMGRPVLFSHERIGFDGKPFRCKKFRTMVKDADKRLASYLREYPAAAAEWEATQKLENDPRTTPLGLLLRKSSLDELPQLVNTLRGDMTIVGPRPVTASELKRYGNSARHYLRTRPGLTGLWQVNGRSNTSYRRRVVLDRTYVSSWSVWLDLKIVLKTAPAIFRLRDAA